jgi:hypothetical protein
VRFNRAVNRVREVRFHEKFIRVFKAQVCEDVPAAALKCYVVVTGLLPRDARGLF